jgi:hypothetical protein
VPYLSFLIRLWFESSLPAAASAPEWHAEVEHIQSGRRWAFDSLDELLEFVRQQAESLAEGDADTSQAVISLKTKRRVEDNEKVRKEDWQCQ